MTPLGGAFFFGRGAAKCIVPALNNGSGQATGPSWVRLGALLCSLPIFLITTSQLLSRDGRLIRATVLLANGRARGCCASALLRREEEGFQRLGSKTSLLVAVFSDSLGDKGTSHANSSVQSSQTSGHISIQAYLISLTCTTHVCLQLSDYI